VLLNARYSKLAIRFSNIVYRFLNKNTPRPTWGRRACRGTTSIRRPLSTLRRRRTLWPTNIGLCCNGQSRDGLLGRAFLRHWIQTTSAFFSCGCFHHIHPSLSGLSTRTTSDWLRLYALEKH